MWRSHGRVTACRQNCKSTVVVGGGVGVGVGGCVVEIDDVISSLFTIFFFILLKLLILFNLFDDDGDGVGVGLVEIVFVVVVFIVVAVVGDDGIYCNDDGKSSSVSFTIFLRYFFATLYTHRKFQIW